MNDRWMTLLQEEFAARKSRNPRYSLRAFARDLGIHASDLSRFLSGSRRMAASTARTVLTNLAWAPDHTQAFVESIFQAMQADFLEGLKNQPANPVNRATREEPNLLG